MASALPCCVVDLVVKVYSYDVRVRAQRCILEDAWVGTAQCSLNRASRGLWSVMRVKW